MGLELKQSNASVGVSAPTAAGEFNVSALCVGAVNLSLSAKPTGPPATAAICGGSDEDSEIPALTATAVEVQVYLPLVCLPKALSLVPQASGAISCSLGPTGVVNKTYVITSATADDVITVDGHGVVTATTVGEAVVRVIYTTAGSGEHPSTSAVADVPVVVTLLEDIQIRSDVNWLAPGSEASVFVEGSAGQSPVSMASLPVEVSFQWKNSDFLLKNPDLLSGILISY